MAASIICLHCGGDLGVGDRFCAQCGAESLSCASCGQTLLSTDLSCPHCGTPAPFFPDPTTTHSDSPSPWTDMVERLRRATLGEFEIGRELGRGGMAAVFLAHDISLDRKVAIKVMSPGLMLGEGMIDRFKHEAITIAHLHHPNIVSVHSVRQAEGLHFFVMRYVQGRSLEQVIRQAGRLPLPMVRSILYQVSGALTYAHRSRVVHRDIKPANILIDHDGDAIVTDFGIAKAAERPSQTLTGALVGTPAYMSPEQCSGDEVTWSSDQYSLGAVAYELVTGVPPFLGSTLTVMQAHVERAPRSIRELCPECPPDLEAAILRMLDKDPEARWPRMAEAMAALGAAPLAEDDPLRAELSRLAAAGGGVSLSGMPTPTSPIPRTRASSAGVEPSRAVGGISIVPAPSGLEVGDCFMLVAVIRGQHGTRLPPQSVAWSTDAPGVLRVDAAGGVATAVAPGSAMLTAVCKGIKALLRVEVAPPRADEIVIGPADEPLHVGGEIRLEATPRDKRGWPVSRPVEWRSAEEEIAVVTPHGAIAGRAPGTVRITAVLDDARASIVIPVLPPRVAVVDIADAPASVPAGRTFVLGVTPLDRMNNRLADRAIVWSTSDMSVAVVTAEGWVAALRPGSAVLTATCEGVSASVRVAVVAETAPGSQTSLPPAVQPAPALASAPAPRRRRRSRRRRLVAGGVGVLLGGTIWSLFGPRRPADHSAAEPAAATGLAAVAGYSTGAVGIDTGAAAAVVITRRPGRALRPDSVTRLAAEVRDAAGRVVPGAALVWSSSDSAVARVDPASGRVRAVRPGRVYVVAANGQRRDSAVIAVHQPGVRLPAAATVTVAPPNPLRMGDSVMLDAVVLDSKGDTLPGANVTWASSDTRVATVEPSSGMVRARSPGSVLILARSGDETTLAELRVLPGAVAALQIIGVRPMAVRETLPLRVQAVDAWGAALAGRPVAWASTDSTVAVVDEASGVVTALTPGSTRITATSEGVTAGIRLNVLPRPEPVRTLANDAEQQRAEAWIRAGVDECYGALQSKDVARLTALYRPANGSDRDKLKKLTHILRTSELAAVVGERVDRDPQVGPGSAAMEFSVSLTWKAPSGGVLTSHPDFRAEFAESGGRWEMSSCRIVGSPRL